MVLSGLNTLLELLTSYQQVINTALIRNYLIMNKLKNLLTIFCFIYYFYYFCKNY